VSWQDNLADLAAAALDPAAFGEPILLPGAAGEVCGIFDPVGDPVIPGSSEVDLTGRLSSQPNPVLWLLDADAAGVAEGVEVRIRWTPYRIVRMDPDGAGMTRCDLMPSSGAGETDRYR
jgi:hypothetical protein